MFNFLVQFISAILIITILGIIAYSIYNKEIQQTLYDMTKPVVIKTKTNIFDGVMPLTATVKPVYDTVDDSSGTYRNLSPSVNQKGGSEYSYNFWILNNKLKQEAINNSIVLFLRGNNNSVNYKSTYNCMASGSKNWFLVKNPLVRLYVNDNSKIESVITEFNSITHPDAFHFNSEKPDCTSDNHEKKFGNHIGIYGLSKRKELEDKWIMITIVVQETNPSNDILFRNKGLVKMYLNGFENLNKDVEIKYDGSTAMKHNQGKLYINPDPDNPDNSDEVYNDMNIQMADLSYFNYALSKDEIINLHKSGFNISPAAIPNENTNDLFLTEKASLDLSSSEYIQSY